MSDASEQNGRDHGAPSYTCPASDDVRKLHAKMADMEVKMTRIVSRLDTIATRLGDIDTIATQLEDTSSRLEGFAELMGIRLKAFGRKRRAPKLVVTRRKAL